MTIEPTCLWCKRAFKDDPRPFEMVVGDIGVHEECRDTVKETLRSMGPTRDEHGRLRQELFQ